MDSRIKSQSTQMAKKGQENLEWEGVIGTPTSICCYIEVNFDPLKLAWLVTCGVQSASSFNMTRVAVWVKRMHYLKFVLKFVFSSKETAKIPTAERLNTPSRKQTCVNQFKLKGF